MADPKTYTEDEYNALVQEKEALKANRDEALTEAKRAKAALKAWDGKDPAKYDQLLAASEEAERRKAAAEGDFTKLRDQMAERHATELGARDKRIQKFEAALNRRLTTDELRKALSGKALPEYEELLVEHGAKYLKVQETDDDFTYVIHDGKGNSLVSDGRGTPMDIATFVDQTLKTKFPGAFAGTGSSGGGAPRSTAGGGGGPKVIAAGDNKAFLANLDDIANGKVEVR